jgi:dTDP-4-amino-4,6-dideoxygalactose transaminase
LKLYQLPPVGNPIKLSSVDNPEHLLDSFFSPYKTQYYASGTAALAATISAAIRSKDVDSPEVILPAYGCPDLVSAAVFAGAKPVLVDLVLDRPWMDLQQLSEHITSNTVAIIAASLFGISERMAELRPIAEQAGVVLIEDSAQAFPGNDESDFWHGDMVVLSFGRGKPVSLLGGGAVLFRDFRLGNLLPAVATQVFTGRRKTGLSRLKVALYNHMISPRMYWLPHNLPFLNLGQTRYHPLTGIDAIDLAQLEMLPANIAAYQGNGMETQAALCGIFKEMNTSATGIIDLPKVCQVSPERRLLRYPLLVNESIRDRLYRQLHRFGSGPSVMYPAALPGIPGLEALLAGQGPFPVAEAFAARILTLPTHRLVGLKDIANIRRVLNSSQESAR